MSRPEKDPAGGLATTSPEATRSAISDAPGGNISHGTGRVLVFRTGSLGDTVVALPCFHLIARVFPSAHRGLLTARTEHASSVDIEALLDGTDLIHETLAYHVTESRLRQAIRISRAIRGFNPDTVVYLAEPRGLASAWRDLAFLKACGVPRVLGLPITSVMRSNRWLPQRRQFEHEAERLARNLADLGDARLGAAASWDLQLHANERARASAALPDWPQETIRIACCPGSKIPSKDWGEARWGELLEHTSRTQPTAGLIFVGGATDRERADRLASRWTGPVHNLCGRLTPRETAGTLAAADLFIGHDGGPMHLAAAAGLPCVAVFSARSLPGVWFPYGRGHEVLYRQTSCHGCELDECTAEAMRCLSAIRVEDVVERVQRMLVAISSVPRRRIAGAGPDRAPAAPAKSVG